MRCVLDGFITGRRSPETSRAREMHIFIDYVWWGCLSVCEYCDSLAAFLWFYGDLERPHDRRSGTGVRVRFFYLFCFCFCFCSFWRAHISKSGPDLAISSTTPRSYNCSPTKNTISDQTRRKRQHICPVHQRARERMRALTPKNPPNTPTAPAVHKHGSRYPRKLPYYHQSSHTAMETRN